MTDFNWTILYVADPLASADFYRGLLGRNPVEASPGFAMFALPSGAMLGLWNQAGVEPKPIASAGSAEMALTVADAAAVDAMHDDWRARGIAILQAPTVMDFGRTFTARDPDGHRLRVFAPAG